MIRGLLYSIPVIFFLLLPPLSGCRTKPSATGKDYELVVLVQGNIWKDMEESIREVFERPIFGVHTEKAFRLIQAVPERPDPYHVWRKIVVVGTVEDTPAVRQLLSEQELSSVEPGKAYIKQMTNVWALGQFVLLYYTRDKESLRSAFSPSGETLFEIVNDAFLKEEWYRMYTSGENSEIERYFAENYGFSIRLPKIYRLADEDTLAVTVGEDTEVEMNAVRVFNLNPQRSFIICWKNGIQDGLDAGKIQGLRQAIGKIYYPGDELLTERIESAGTTIAGQSAVRLRGVWENREQLQGGLFLTYAFNCPENDRFYLIDGILFHPNPEKSKYPYMVQLSMILHSFTCCADTAAAGAQSESFDIDVESLF